MSRPDESTDSFAFAENHASNGNCSELTRLTRFRVYSPFLMRVRAFFLKIPLVARARQSTPLDGCVSHLVAGHTSSAEAGRRALRNLKQLPNANCIREKMRFRAYCHEPVRLFGDFSRRENRHQQMTDWATFSPRESSDSNCHVLG